MSALDHFMKIIDCKKKMIDRNLTRAKANCPACKGKDTLKLKLVPNRRSNGAMRWHCSNCTFAGME